TREGQIEDHVVEAAAGRQSIALSQLSTRQSSRNGGGRRADFLQFVGVAGVGPISQGCAQIGQRITQRTHLPVQNSDDLCNVIRVEYDVVVLIVVVNQRGVARRWKVMREPRGNASDFRQVVSGCIVIALDTSLHLAFEVALRLTQIAEADLVVVEAVQAHEVVEESFAELACQGGRQQQAGRQLSAQDDASNRLHEVEGGVKNRKIVAIKDHL